MNEQWQTIVILKGSAGKLTLLGQVDQHGQWSFRHQADTQQSDTAARTVNSFNEALTLLGQSWKYLQPEYIHPQFKHALWKNINADKGFFNRAHWRRACL